MDEDLQPGQASVHRRGLSRSDSTSNLIRVEEGATKAAASTEKENPIFLPSTEKRQHNIFIFLGLLLATLFLIIFVVSTFPQMPEEHKDYIKFPTSLDNVKKLGMVLSLYTTNYYLHVYFLFCLTYIFLQAFSIPGSICMSFLAGAIFGLPVGFFTVCIVATIGASLSYLLSQYFVGGLVNRYFPTKLDQFAYEVEKHKHNLFSYILFLRISPLLPNWFINLASPLLHIPYSYFGMGTLLGIMPATFICVKAGLTLQELTAASEVIDRTAIATLFGLALLTLLPTWPPVQNRLSSLFKIKSK